MNTHLLKLLNTTINTEINISAAERVAKVEFDLIDNELNFYEESGHKISNLTMEEFNSLNEMFNYEISEWINTKATKVIR